MIGSGIVVPGTAMPTPTTWSRMSQTTSAQPQSARSTATCSVQPPFTKHFPSQPKNDNVEGKKTTAANDSAQASGSALPEV